MKRAISLILALVMLAGVTPNPAMAGEVSETTAAQETTAEAQESTQTQQTEEPPAITETTAQATEETPTQATEQTPTQATEVEPTQAAEETLPPTTEETQPSETAETQPGETAAEPLKEPEILSWEDFQYTLLADGTASVCGFTGTPEDGDKPFFVEIPSDIQGAAVTEIGERAFAENAEIDGVLLPETLRAVGDSAFEACENLQWIGFRGEVPSFGASFVKDCGKLEEIGILAEEDFTPLQELLKTDLGEEAAQNVRFQSFADAQTLEEHYTARIPEASVESASTAESVMSTSAVVASGTCGESLTWELGSDGNLTISGTGKMDDYDHNSSGGTAPWNKYFKEITCVTIDHGITSIGDSTFDGCSNLSSVTIPNSVTVIGDWAFSDCYSLSSMTIPDSVTYIGSYAFDNCDMTSVTIPGSVTFIDNGAFRYCYSLSSVTIPDSVTYIGAQAFSYCSSLSSVTIPDSVTYIGNEAFSHCSSLSSVTIPDSATIPDSVTYIGDWAFSDCSSLSSVTIPDGVTSIGGGAFSGCSSLNSVTIPDSVTSIGGDAFSGCSNLSSVTIPDSVTSIGDWAFSDCSSLSSVTIPDSVISIGGGAFCECSSLSSVTIPDSVTSIGSDAFLGCSNLSSVTIPDSVTSIGEYTFYKCSSLSSVTISGSVTSIGRFAFSDCTRLTSVAIPDSVTSIGAAAFSDCSSLTDVYYSGSESKWKAITIDPDNEILLSATIHFNSTGPDDTVKPTAGRRFNNHLYELYDLSMTWAEAKEYCEKLGGHLVAITSAKEQAFLESFLPDPCTKQQYWIGASDESGAWNWVTGETFEYANWDLEQPDPLDGEHYAQISNCAVSDLPHPVNRYKWNRAKANNDYESESCNPNTVGFICEYDMESDRIRHYLDNSAIKINKSGKAYAFFEGDPLQIFHYIAGGTQGSAKSDEKGVFCVPLGNFDSVADYRVAVKFTQIGEEVLERPIMLDTAVTVTPLYFSQSWKASFDASVGAKLSAGPGFKFEIGPIEAEATFGSVGGEVSGGNTMKISRSVSADGETLELTSEKKIAMGATVKSGINGKTLKSEIKAEVSAGAKKSDTCTYGIKFENYSAVNTDQQRAIATYLLGEALEANPNNLLYRYFYQNLADHVYTDAGCIVISGSGTEISGNVGGEFGGIKVNDKELLSLLEAKAEAAVSMGETSTSAGEREKSTSYKSSVNLSAFTGKTEIGEDAALKGSVLSTDFLGKDISVTAKSSKIITDHGAKEERELETTSLSASAPGIEWLHLGKRSSAEYNKYVFKDEALDGLLSKTPSFASYMNRNRMVLSAYDLAQLGRALSVSDVPIEYSNQVKNKVLYSFPFKVGVSLYAGVDFGVKVSYMEDTSYTKGAGFVKDDRIWVAGQSDDIDSQVDAKSMELMDFFTKVMRSLVVDSANFFEEASAPIRDGVSNAWAWVEEKADSASDWLVSLVAPPDPKGSSVWAMSERVSVYARRDTASMPDGIRAADSGFELSKAATVGRPIVVSVRDANSGETITDLSAEPLTLTISYAPEDLTAAGLSAQSAIVLDGGIAIYRYSDNGDYFEYVGGINDLDAMTVTAAIDKPGQYILAVDACTPQITSLDISDFHTNPTITASIDDLSGLDVSKFQFMLDGIVKVDAGNIVEHYNSQAGIFTYTVPEGESLSEGSHTIDFTLADTTGNAESYTYSFFVDLTAPEVSQVSVNGTTNAGSNLEIRAQASDENLTSVYAVFSMRLPDGTWSEEVSTEMGQLEDGSWALDYEGSGSSVKVHVLAVDIAGNRTSSETYEAKPVVESVQLTQEYVLLREGQKVTLQAEVLPAELAPMVDWQVEAGGEDILSVDQSGEVTALKQGTAYVLASVNDGDGIMTARCRVDVAERIRLDGIQLGTPSLTTQLFSTQYAAFDVILLLEQNQPMISTFSLRDPVENNGVSVTSARFADGAAAERFDLAVKDDRTLLVVPKQTALDDPRGVAKSYTSQVCVNVDGVEYTTDASLKLTVKKSTPKLKAAALSFNSFYPGQTQPSGITGATVTGILRDESKDTAKSSALPVWLTLTEDTLSLNENAPAKAASGNVYILVETEEWAIPAPVKVPVKLTYKAPGVKLSKTSATFAGVFADSQGVSLKLVCTNKKDTLEDLHVSGIEAPEGFEVRDVDLTDGSFLLKPAREVIPGKKTILVNFSDTEKQLPLTLTVKKKTVALSAKPSTVTLNSVLGDSAVIPLTAAPADYRVTAPSFRLVDGKGADTDQLDYRFENGAVTVSTNAATVPGSAYKLYVCAGGSREIALTIRTLAEKKAAPTLSVKTAGAIDLSFPESAATVTAQFKNYFSGMYTDLDWTVTAYSGKTELGDVTNLFKLESSGGKFRVARKEEAELSAKNSYQLTMTFTLPEDRTCTQTVKLPVKRTAVKLKLSKSSLSLNKALDDWAAVDVTCLTKGYRFDEPVISGPDSLAATYSAGRLTVSTNERTEYGKTYRILLKATELDKAVTLTVKIPAQNRSNVTASLRAAGSIDVIRDGTSITLTPAYKNCLRQPDGECSVQIYSSADKYTEPVTDLFRIAQNEDGQFVITRGENSQINTRLKYRAVLTAKFGETSVSSKPVSLKIRAGSAKLRVEASNAVLYAADRNSRAEFRLVPGDPKLNRIRTVEFRSAADRALFALYDYGNGNYAVGFKDGEVDRSLLGKTSRSLTLEITLDGNGSPGAKISTTLKLRLVPYA